MSLALQEIEAKVRAAISRAQGGRYIDADANADLGLDSLEKIEVSIEVEEEFGFQIPDEDLDNFTNGTSIADWVETVKAKLAEAGC